MLGLRIAGTGSFLPGPPVPNSVLEAESGGAFEAAWVEQWTGIRTRHRAGPRDSVASLAAEASSRALDAAGIAASDLRRILLTTSTGGDRPGPATALDLQARLGTSCLAMDIANGCHGFMTALDLGARLVATGEAPVLIVASELLTRHRLDPGDRRVFPLFGDGAAAVVLDAPRAEGGLLSSVHASRGEHLRALFCPGLDDPEVVDGATIRFLASGREMKRYVEELLPGLVLQAMAEAGVGPADIDWLVPHQPNAAWIVQLAALLGVPVERVPIVVDRSANLPTAMVPLGLDQLWRSGRVRPGQLILSFGLGAGISFGATVLRVD